MYENSEFTLMGNGYDVDEKTRILDFYPFGRGLDDLILSHSDLWRGRSLKDVYGCLCFSLENEFRYV